MCDCSSIADVNISPTTEALERADRTWTEAVVEDKYKLRCGTTISIEHHGSIYGEDIGKILERN